MDRLIEALMYVRGEEGLTPKDLKAVEEISTADARKALKSFKESYNSKNTPLVVFEYNDNFKLGTREEFREPIGKLVTHVKKQKLSNSAIETAGIIAYKQPITKSQVNEIRGVSSEAVVNTLLTKGLIEEVGVAETPGSPVLYGITNKFYDYFNIRSLAELPQLSEFDESEGTEQSFDLFSSQRED